MEMIIKDFYKDKRLKYIYFFENYRCFFKFLESFIHIRYLGSPRGFETPIIRVTAITINTFKRFLIEFSKFLTTDRETC